MKFRFLVVAFLLSCTLVMGGQAGHPVRPGIREADKLTNPAVPVSTLLGGNRPPT
jgi:hypothetical protein